MKVPHWVLWVVTLGSLLYLTQKIIYLTDVTFRWTPLGFEYVINQAEGELRVSALDSNGPAANSGLAVGDVLVTSNGTNFSGLNEFAVLVGKAEHSRILLLQARKADGSVRPCQINLPPPFSNGGYPLNLFFWASQVFIGILCTGIGLTILWQRWSDGTGRLGGFFFLSFAVLFDQPFFYVSEYARPFMLLYRPLLAQTAGLWAFAFFSEFPAASAFATRWRITRHYYLAALIVVLPVAIYANLCLYYSFDLAAQLFPWQGFLDSARSFFLFIGFILTPLNFIPGIRGKLDQDQSRRLRVLSFGAVFGFSPLLLLSFINYVHHGRLVLESYPSWVWAVAIGLNALFPITFAYTVVKHRVLGIKQILRRSVQYAFWSHSYLLIEVGLLVFLLKYPVKTLLLVSMEFMGMYPEPNTWRFCLYVLGGGGLLGMLRVNPRLQAAIDRAFFRDAYNAQQVLGDLSRAVRNLTKAEDVLHQVAEQIGLALHVNRIGFFVHPSLLETVPETVPAASHFCGYLCHFDGTPPGLVESPEQFPLTGLVMEWLETDVFPREVEFAAADSWLAEKLAGNPDLGSFQDLQVEWQHLQALEACVLVPLVTSNRVMGFISLGPKLSEEPYTKEDKELLMAVAEATSLRLENTQLIGRMAEEATLKRELEIAKAMQQSLLPARHPHLPGYEISGFSTAANDVGGDYFDFFLAGPDRLAIAVGDVTGHGVSSGLLMALAKGGFLNQVSSNHEPQSVMFAMNNLIHSSGSRRNLMTFAYAVLDGKNRTLQFSNAGHPHPYRYIAAHGQVEPLEMAAYPLGVRKNTNYETLTLQLEPGDAVVFYSDGIVEAQNEAGELFGYERLEAAIALHGAKPGATLREALLTTAQEFVEGVPFSDDLTVVVVQVQLSEKEQKAVPIREEAIQNTG
ncbi:MAG: SpoIIE family protein phosphatase [Blastocatellia bacterium]|nr:SpoIIE family protein phosphatase [Blastocatellia bacterium]